MLTPENVLVGIELMYGVGGLFAAFVAALWRLFSKYTALDNEIKMLKRDYEKDDQKYIEILRRMDKIQDEVSKMRLEMLSAHGEISERVIRMEATSTK